jgi:hypothetical protein
MIGRGNEWTVVQDVTPGLDKLRPILGHSEIIFGVLAGQLERLGFKPSQDAFPEHLLG